MTLSSLLFSAWQRKLAFSSPNNNILRIFLIAAFYSVTVTGLFVLYFLQFCVETFDVLIWGFDELE